MFFVIYLVCDIFDIILFFRKNVVLWVKNLKKNLYSFFPGFVVLPKLVFPKIENKMNT